MVRPIRSVGNLYEAVTKHAGQETSDFGREGLLVASSLRPWTVCVRPFCTISPCVWRFDEHIHCRTARNSSLGACVLVL